MVRTKIGEHLNSIRLKNSASLSCFSPLTQNQECRWTRVLNNTM